ncbi:MAG: response regulator [Clostridiales bacterium]|nr:response regulator [Clostridiales bacterium]
MMKDINYKDAKILVVDDVEEVLHSTRNCLKFEGMNVECIQNPIEALEYLKNNDVDVLLLDFFMPQMNGDKFIEELRKFNNETIIILRTGYSDQVPPLEMIDTLKIQGYIDKLKGDAELILLTKSAIKTSFMYKEIIEQQRKINMLEYKNEFSGKFINKLIGEIKEKSMVIGGLSNIMSDKSIEISEEEQLKFSKEINESIANLSKYAKMLEIENLGSINISTLGEILKSLFNLDLKVKNIKFDMKLNQDFIIQYKTEIIIYILTTLIEELIDSSTDIIISSIENSYIEIMGNFNDNTILKIKDIAKKSNEKINIEYTTNSVKIILL